jgi:hypothetical protein
MLKHKKTKIVVFWHVMPYSVIHGHQTFEEFCYVHLQDSYVLTTPNEARKTKDEMNSELTS